MLEWGVTPVQRLRRVVGQVRGGLWAKFAAWCGRGRAVMALATGVREDFDR
jgi:hypothetical protein